MTLERPRGRADGWLDVLGSMSERIAFERPPVTEVVFSVAFALAHPMATPHVGAYWTRIRDRFPTIQENIPLPPLQPPQFVGGEPQLQQVQFALLDLPPLRRVWFVSHDGRDLIQLQDDRFVFNWRRNEADGDYPGYDKVEARFEEHLAEFVRFLSEEDLGMPSYSGFELAYVNQLDEQNGLREVGFGAMLVDHRREDRAERFLAAPFAGNSTSLYRLPNNFGMLQVQSQGNPTGLRLDMVARGAATAGGDEARRAWFALAHDTIVRGFVDVTNPELHKRDWGRID